MTTSLFTHKGKEGSQMPTSSTLDPPTVEETATGTFTPPNPADAHCLRFGAMQRSAIELRDQALRPALDAVAEATTYDELVKAHGALLAAVPVADEIYRRHLAAAIDVSIEVPS